MEVKLSNEASRQILAALKQNDVVAAIKIYREQANCDLAEARRAVEQLHKVSDMLGAIGTPFGDGASANISTSVSTSKLTINNVRVPDDIAEKIQAALQSGDESAVIDMLRSTCNLDAKNARNILERMKEMHALARQVDTSQFKDEYGKNDEGDNKTASEVLSAIRSAFEKNAFETDANITITVNGIEMSDGLVEKIRIALQSENEPDVLKTLHDTCNLDLNGETNSVSVGAATVITYQSYKKQIKTRDTAKPQPRPDATPSSSQVVGAGDSPYGNILMLVSLIVLVIVAAWWFFSR